MFSQSNINNILDHQHSNGRLISFTNGYFLALKMDIFIHFPPENTVEMLTTVPVRFNDEIGIFSSASKEEVRRYTTFLVRRFGLVTGQEIVSADCTNLVSSNVYKACFIEPSPWLVLMTGQTENYASFIPLNRYNQIDYVFRQYQLVQSDNNINIQTEGVASGLIRLI